MKKILTIIGLVVLLFAANKTTLASELVINDPKVDVIIEKSSSKFAQAMGKAEHYVELYASTVRGLSRPGGAYSLSSPYYFYLNTTSSSIYSNYYFTNHNGRMNILLDEYYGQRLFQKTYKFYLYEQTTNRQVMSADISKGDQVIVHVFNLTSNKGYYFKIVPNGQTDIDGKVYR